MSNSFDLVVLGSGSAGSITAMRCQAAGWNVAIADDQPFGGTCANRGCDPKKVLVGAADVVAWQRRMREHGVTGDARIDWPALMSFKRSFTDQVPANTEAKFAQAGIELLHGAGRFTAEDRIAVGERELTARHILIATGASPQPLGIPGEEHVIDSTQFLELEALPRRIVFVGAGYISLEFAHLAHHAGAEVVVLGRGAPLPGFDEALVERLLDRTSTIGIDLRLRCPVTAVERDASTGSFRVHVSHGEHAHVIETDLVVHGAGRIPNTAHLDAKSGHVELGKKGIVCVNDFMQSISNPRVYAAGDVTSLHGAAPLTPVASHESVAVSENLLHGNSASPDLRAVPSVVFTLPALACVGMTEKAAREKGIKVRVKSGDSTKWYTNRRISEPVGMFKTIVDEESDRIVGAHLLGAYAEEVINLFALAIRFGITAKEMKKTVYAYPTSGSDMSYLL